MIYPRKEVKSYGTSQRIEGVYQAGHIVVLIEDVITTGGSLVNTIQTLERAELVVKDVIVLVDREQGGRERLKAAGYELHAILTLRFILDTLKAKGLIDSATYRRVIKSVTK
jgi:uridine monophosphate synthetase